MRELTSSEVEQVGGGFPPLLMAALTVYAIADIAYGFGSGVAGGYRSTAN